LDSKPTNLTSWGDGCSLAKGRAEAEAALASPGLRALDKKEIENLESQGNRCADWKRVRVASDFLAEAIFGSEFLGDVRLGRFATDDPGRSGIYDSSVEDCAIASGARVFRCGLVSRAFVAEGAVLESVGRLGTSGASSRFGNGLVLFDGPLYSRALVIAAELPFEWAAWATGPVSGKDENRTLAQVLAETMQTNSAAMESPTAYIGPGAEIRCTPIVEDCWIGPNVQVDGANSLRASTIWGTDAARTRIADGAHLAGALIGPGCDLAQQCTVENSLFTEFVRVGHQAIIKGSVVGANARLAECEISDSLLGPFTTAVHHALVISAWWPEGRGNVGYGANVGSNHTGRAPDQEIWVGEGVFFGLGSNVKFPCNFREAPYSIIATGVDVLPQKVTFPFSLIASPFLAQASGVPPAYNEIRPGWAILQNAYGLARLEQNLAERDRAGSAPEALAVFRADVVKGLLASHSALDAVEPSEISAYTEAEIPGLGKNYLTEPGRAEALRAYLLGTRHGAASAMLNTLNAMAEGTRDEGNENLARLKDAFEWVGPIFDAENPKGLTESIFEAEQDWLEAVVQSRLKDEKRGVVIIDDYASRHIGAEEDPVLIEERESLEGHKERRAEYTDLLETYLYKKSKA